LLTNQLKRALHEGRAQIGLWSSLSSHITVEVIAGSGFDWLLLDTEHSPNEPTMIHSQLQAMQGSATAAVVRPAWNDPVLFKRLLDIGVQTLLVPFVQNADEAKRAVAATRYPPDGVRGVATTTRASRYGRVKDYLKRANDEICIVVQIETRVSLGNLEAIAAVDGVDGLFIGPSDLAADLGHLGDNAHPEGLCEPATSRPMDLRASRSTSQARAGLSPTMSMEASSQAPWTPRRWRRSVPSCLRLSSRCRRAFVCWACRSPRSRPMRRTTISRWL